MRKAPKGPFSFVLFVDVPVPSAYAAVEIYLEDSAWIGIDKVDVAVAAHQPGAPFGRGLGESVILPAPDDLGNDIAVTAPLEAQGRRIFVGTNHLYLLPYEPSS